MSQSFTKHLVNKLIDWLIAFSGAILLLWFVITQPVFINKPKEITTRLDTQELKKHVQLLTERYAPRTINYDNLNDTAEYIYRQFSAVGIPEYQSINTIAQEYRNVSMQLGPDTQELYVIGAHYDAADDSIYTEGNASGVAALIELARLLADNNHKLEIGVILIAYPLSLNQADNNVNTGSYFHATSLKKINKSVRLMISLDSVGQINSHSNSKKYPYKFMSFLYPHDSNNVNLEGRLKDFKDIRILKKVFNSSSRLSLHSHNHLENFNKIHSSDHVNYWEQGFPAVLISDTVNYGNTAYLKSSMVKPKDRLDYEKIARLIRGFSQVVIETRTNRSEEKIQFTQRSRKKDLNHYCISGGCIKMTPPHF